jgi:hypothetical protein
MIGGMRRGRFAFVAVGVLVLVSHRASAQPSASATGAAVALFDEGRRLMDQGNYAEACPKLARSQQVAPNGGTLFVLADCYEKNGQHASAWVTYKEAAARAVSAGKTDAERLALDAVNAITPSVTWVTLEVTDTEGLAVLRDGEEVARPEWGVAMPLDPGVHRFEARARGKKTWSSDVHVTAAGQRLRVDVPKLEADVARSTGGPVEAGSSSWGTQRLVGLGIAGAGVAGLVVGTIFGLRASSKNDEAASHCVGDKYCDGDGLRLDDEGRSAGAVSTVAFIAGGAALATGAIVFLTAPPGRPSDGASASAGRGLRVGGAGAPGLGGGGGSFALRVTGSF